MREKDIENYRKMRWVVVLDKVFLKFLSVTSMVIESRHKKKKKTKNIKLSLSPSEGLKEAYKKKNFIENAVHQEEVDKVNNSR